VSLIPRPSYTDDKAGVCSAMQGYPPW